MNQVSALLELIFLSLNLKSSKIMLCADAADTNVVRVPLNRFLVSIKPSIEVKNKGSWGDLIP